ncbi:MAG: hypothetical protein AB1806_07970 [Acidobacteriota bacterium]
MKHALALLTVLLWPVNALAQTTLPALPSRVEIWGGWALAWPTSGGLVEVEYEPVLRLGGTPLDSRGTQVLAVDTETGRGLDLGVNVFFSRQLGVQVAFTRSSADVSGTAGEYSDYLQYISRPPPWYDPVVGTYARTSPAQAAVGRMKYRSLGFGGVARWEDARGRVGGTISGGVNVDRYSGEVENVVYTQFVLGGHSTLFPVHHRVVMALDEDKSFWGPYVAADFHVRVASRLAVLAGVRGSLGSRVTIPAGPVRLVDPNEDTWSPELTDVQRVLGTQPLELPSARWHLIIGAKVFVK